MLSLLFSFTPYQKFPTMYFQNRVNEEIEKIQLRKNKVNIGNNFRDESSKKYLRWYGKKPQCWNRKWFLVSTYFLIWCSSSRICRRRPACRRTRAAGEDCASRSPLVVGVLPPPGDASTPSTRTGKAGRGKNSWSELAKAHTKKQEILLTTFQVFRTSVEPISLVTMILSSHPTWRRINTSLPIGIKANEV